MDHDRCHVCRDDKELAFFLGAYGCARLDVVEDGHFPGAVSGFDGVGEFSALGFELDFEKAFQEDDQALILEFRVDELGSRFDNFSRAGKEKARQFFELHVLEDIQIVEGISGNG